MSSYEIIKGNALNVLKTLPDNYFHSIVTSPPYWQLRDYFCEGQLGMEETPEEFVESLVAIMSEAKRVLRSDGVMWMVLGDTYSTPKKGNTQDNVNTRLRRDKLHGQGIDKKIQKGMKKKNLLGVPWKVAFGLQADGWILRCDTIWNKTNGMPDCLSPLTQVFIREGDLVYRKNLSYIWDNRNRLSGLKILSPQGWVDIKGVWETKKRAAILELSNIEKIEMSVNHKLPTCSDRRRKKIENIKAIDIKRSRRLCLYRPIGDFLISTKKYIDMVDVSIHQQEEKLYILGDSSKIKSRKPRSSPSWSDICKKYGYKIQKSKTGYETPLKRLMLKNLIPCKIALGERYNYKNDYIVSSLSSGKSPCFLKMDYDLGRLIGLYAAEGGFLEGRERGSGKFTFHKKETRYIDFVINKLLDFEVKARKKVIDNYSTIRFNSLLISSLLQFFVRGRCKNKSLNMDYILNTPKSFRQGIFAGAIEGDGHIRDNKGFSYTSASEQLIDDMKTLASSLNVICAKIKNEQIDKRSYKTYTSYTIYNSYRNRSKREDNTFAIYPRKVKTTDAECKMLDIEVDGGLFIIGDGLISHNSAKDRPTRCHEYVFMFTKREKYFYDYLAVMERAKTLKSTKRKFGAKNQKGTYRNDQDRYFTDNGMRNKRSVWSVPVASGGGKHFATFPVKLIEPCILSSASVHGCCSKCGNALKNTKEGKIVSICDCKDGINNCRVLDPFSGTATTGVVCLGHDIDYVGIELNEEYIEVSKERLDAVDPIFGGM